MPRDPLSVLNDINVSSTCDAQRFIAFITSRACALFRGFRFDARRQSESLLPRRGKRKEPYVGEGREETRGYQLQRDNFTSARRERADRLKLARAGLSRAERFSCTFGNPRPAGSRARVCVCVCEVSSLEARAAPIVPKAKSVSLSLSRRSFCVAAGAAINGSAESAVCARRAHVSGAAQHGSVSRRKVWERLVHAVLSGAGERRDAGVTEPPRGGSSGQHAAAAPGPSMDALDDLLQAHAWAAAGGGVHQHQHFVTGAAAKPLPPAASADSTSPPPSDGLLGDKRSANSIRALNSEVLRDGEDEATSLRIDQRGNARAGETGLSPRKYADQRHHPARFSHAKIRERPHRESSPARLGGRRVVQPLHHHGPFPTLIKHYDDWIAVLLDSSWFNHEAVTDKKQACSGVMINTVRSWQKAKLDNPLYTRDIIVCFSLTLLLPPYFWLTVKESKELSSSHNSRRKRREQVFGVYVASE
ncbi:hypothetical protein PR048_028971 [Dryococelus australis]|uniref:Uncharacterized protein n=1 Tax=Dryococelus australis TaxID=614101 RepID=A0ABQ9GC24_9NEOP|nr:hypothetical protein PR048_028971 [Dryococelus australis]